MHGCVYVSISVLLFLCVDVVVAVYFTSQILTGRLPNNKKAKDKKIIINEIKGEINSLKKL